MLVPLAAQRGVLGSVRDRFGPIVVLSFVQVAVPLTLIGLGEERIASSLTGILVATAPIFTFLLAFALSGEQRANTASLVGVAIGIVGVGMLLGVDAGGGAEALVGGMFIILAAFATPLPRGTQRIWPWWSPSRRCRTQVCRGVTLPIGCAHPESAPSLDSIASLLTLAWSAGFGS